MAGTRAISAAPITKGLLSAVARWELGFRRQAQEDRFEQAGERLTTDSTGRRRAAEARRAVDDTVQVVRVTIPWLALAQRKTPAIRSFLAKQSYGNWSEAARYVVEFVDFDLSPCWVLVDDLDEIDLDDMISSQHAARRMVEHVGIGRTDGRSLSRSEGRRIAKLVKDDLLFDRVGEEEHLEIEVGREVLAYVMNLE
ncbi:MAG: hypothetical protein ACJ79R_17935 [Anaeromyxobacteraceae bacterium]